MAVKIKSEAILVGFVIIICNCITYFLMRI
jgi:hypothetical protein